MLGILGSNPWHLAKIELYEIFAESNWIIFALVGKSSANVSSSELESHKLVVAIEAMVCLIGVFNFLIDFGELSGELTVELYSSSIDCDELEELLSILSRVSFWSKKIYKTIFIK